MEYVCVLLVSIFLAVISTLILMPILHKHKFGQNIYELGPQTHKKKQGTPTMGGIALIIATTGPSLFLLLYEYFTGSEHYSLLLIAVIAGLLFSIIGFADDYIKVVKKRSLGLTAGQKILYQSICSIVICILIYLNPNISTSIYIPIANIQLDFGYWFYPLIMFVFVATTNSSNLLDGLDGLLTSCGIIIYIGFGIICFLMYQGAVSIVNTPDFAAEIYNIYIYVIYSIGACIGFLIFNRHPARIFMGDTGSFFIGANIAILAIITNTTILLPIMAFTVLISSLSVITQRAYFKITHGKRIFKMSPIHYHFELSGMKETKIVFMYSAAQAVFCGIVLTIFIVFS